MSIQELKDLANKNKKEGNIEEALRLYKELWKREKNQWNGYFLAQCFRKNQDFDEARKLHDQLEKSYPHFKPLKNDKLWLDYSQKIKDWTNPNIIEDANNILSNSNQYDKYTSGIYTKTVLSTIKYLCHKDEYILAYEWILKLDQSIISNNVFKFEEKTYPADRKAFFIMYADILVKTNKDIDYIEKCLTNLNFQEDRLSVFVEKIFSNVKFYNPNEGTEFISKRRLAKHIKNFQEEFYLRLNKAPKQIYAKNKVTLVSDLSHYLFCPVSYAINETYLITANTSWEKDEWLGEKKTFIDRYNIFKQKKSFNESFEDSEINVSDKLKADFEYIFNSNIIVNNTISITPTVYTNKDKTLKGAPDYVMQDNKGIKYTITEKFSHVNSANTSHPFDSDLIKHFAFIEEFTTANISFGYLITWYWDLTDVETRNGSIQKKMVVRSCRLTKIEKSKANAKKLQKELAELRRFKQKQFRKVNDTRAFSVNKCLNCSVISYCNHKTGSFNLIELPYNLNSNKVLPEPQIEFTKKETPIQKNNIDDLPF